MPRNGKDIERIRKINKYATLGRWCAEPGCATEVWIYVHNRNSKARHTDLYCKAHHRYGKVERDKAKEMGK